MIIIICRPYPSSLIRFLWMIWNMLNRMKNEIIFYSDFYFFELSWKIHRKLGWWCHKNDHNSKNKNRKHLNLGFSFYSADCGFFSCKFDHFWRNFYLFNILMFLETWIFFYRKRAKKKLSKVVKFTWKIWNRLNRKKNQISDFSDFHFLSYAEKH